MRQLVAVAIDEVALPEKYWPPLDEVQVVVQAGPVPRRMLRPPARVVGGVARTRLSVIEKTRACPVRPCESVAWALMR